MRQMRSPAASLTSQAAKTLEIHIAPEAPASLTTITGSLSLHILIETGEKGAVVP